MSIPPRQLPPTSVRCSFHMTILWIHDTFPASSPGYDTALLTDDNSRYLLCRRRSPISRLFCVPSGSVGGVSKKRRKKKSARCFGLVQSDSPMSEGVEDRSITRVLCSSEARSPWTRPPRLVVKIVYLPQQSYGSNHDINDERARQIHVCCVPA